MDGWRSRSDLQFAVIRVTSCERATMRMEGLEQRFQHGPDALHGTDFWGAVEDLGEVVAGDSSNAAAWRVLSRNPAARHGAGAFPPCRPRATRHPCVLGSPCR